MAMKFNFVGGIVNKHEYPTFARGVRTGAIYFMSDAQNGTVVKAAPGAPYGTKWRDHGDAWDYIPPGTKIEITV